MLTMLSMAHSDGEQHNAKDEEAHWNGMYPLGPHRVTSLAQVSLRGSHIPPMPSFWTSVEGEIESACQELVPFYLSFMEHVCLPNVAEVPVSEMQVSQRVGHGFLGVCIGVLPLFSVCGPPGGG